MALLVSQAAEGFRLWTGEAFDVEEMAATLDALETGESE
jgi:shikimate 5-dehydrogenase